jgi:hypothetical protein
MIALKHRLVTRADLDGVACAVLLNELELIDDVLFTHPSDVIDGQVEIGSRDLLANLPYVATAHRVFDHRSPPQLRSTAHVCNHVLDPNSPSAARLIWLHYGGNFSMPHVRESMLDAVDQSSQAKFTIEDILHPAGWILMNFIMDSRTGLGRFRRFRISNLQLMHALVAMCRTMDIDEILQTSDVRERVELYRAHEGRAVDQMLEASQQQGKTLLMDLRNQDPIWAANRFVPYALFPQCSIVIRRMWGRDRRNTVFALGRSIFDRSSTVDIGALCERYGGSGHLYAGTCQIEHSMADKVLDELMQAVQDDPRERFLGLKPPGDRH